jgi:hypothetical protein
LFKGRIGFAFSLVEPEELGFMMDVHTFLGKDIQVISQDAPPKKLVNEIEDNGEITVSQNEPLLTTYNLETMIPR